MQKSRIELGSLCKTAELILAARVLVTPLNVSVTQLEIGLSRFMDVPGYIACLVVSFHLTEATERDAFIVQEEDLLRKEDDDDYDVDDDDDDDDAMRKRCCSEDLAERSSTSWS
ncbi:hypothetical protein M0802_007093 [Mischocyttarus mexicanus]|nr:hypothetical protein M0802_007093 [Mischocyttarus mexicanus]